MNIRPASTDDLHLSAAAAPLHVPAESTTSARAPGAMTSRTAVNDGYPRGVTSTLRRAVARVQYWVRSLGPYVAIELLLPGGTLIALALWTYRRLRSGAAGTRAIAAPAAPTPNSPPPVCLAPCGQR